MQIFAVTELNRLDEVLKARDGGQGFDIVVPRSLKHFESFERMVKRHVYGGVNVTRSQAIKDNFLVGRRWILPSIGFGAENLSVRLKEDVEAIILEFRPV